MSSIEKAIDRLEGRTPGADTNKDAGAAQAEHASTTKATEGSDETGGLTGKNPLPASEHPLGLETAPAPAGPVSDTDGLSNKISIDFDRLEAAGYLTPNAVRTQQSEEYQHIKRRLLGNIALNAISNDAAKNLIMITSSVPGEGKTFTSINLTMSLAMELDHTVLLVDTDLMKQDLSRQLGLVNRPGLYDYLCDDVADVSGVMYRSNQPNLAIIPSGTYTDTSTELVASKKMRELMRQFATRYNDRIVIFDTPPLLATSTAVALASEVGQVVLVVEAGETRTSTVKAAFRVIDPYPVTGVILNKSKTMRDGTGYYYGSYYYGGGQSSA